MQGSQITKAVEQTGSDLECGAPGGPGAQQQSEKFCVTESLGTVHRIMFARWHGASETLLSEGRANVK